VSSAAARVLGDLAQDSTEVECRPEICTVRFIYDGYTQDYAAAANARPFHTLLVAVAEYGFNGFIGSSGPDRGGKCCTINTYLWRTRQ